MTVPVIAARRFAAGIVLGMILGIWHGFLRPVRQRSAVAGDLLFLPGLGWAWIYLMFGICRGDLRVGAFGALLAGCMIWEATAGKLLQPVFEGFWKGIMRVSDILRYPSKKIFGKNENFNCIFEKMGYNKVE